MKRTKITNSIRRLRFIYDEMSQQELAGKVGCTRQTIISIEKNRHTPSILLAFKIAAVFSVTLEKVFQYTEESESA
ncbi:helix-turn-helix transcriptional regulator [bacterium]|nr:helix-turn-helix transcriptional regulator [bacterium]MBU1026032.1 helix-turn-helix transcriptional regulator [bacterium]